MRANETAPPDIQELTFVCWFVGQDHLFKVGKMLIFMLILYAKHRERGEAIKRTPPAARAAESKKKGTQR